METGGGDISETTSVMKKEGEQKSTTNIGASLTRTSGIKRRAANKPVAQNSNTSLNIGGQGSWLVMEVVIKYCGSG